MSEALDHRLHLARPDIGDRELELVGQVLASDVLALGPFAVQFEEAIAAQAGRQYGVSCSSGTAGLHMVVRGLGIGEGDEVITTPFSFVASANCIVYERAKPVFVDIEEDSLGLDPDLVEAAASPRTVGVLPVHVFGRPCRIEDVAVIAERRGWRLVEDACEALGSSVSASPAGSFGDASVFAFYPNKQVTTGEGGVVVTDDEDLATTLRSLRNQGRDESYEGLRFARLGFNYRMDEMSAAVGVAQLERIEGTRLKRRQLSDTYAAALAGLDWITLPEPGAGQSVDWFVYVVRLDPSIDRARVIDGLKALGVPSRAYFTPLHLEPVYRELLGHAEGDFPVTERVAATTLALPWSATMSDEDVRYVSEGLIGVIENG